MKAMEDISEKEIERIGSDIEWTAKNAKKLFIDYEGKYIAVKDKRIIAASSDFEELLRILERDSINPRLVHIESVAPRSFACIL